MHQAIVTDIVRQNNVAPADEDSDGPADGPATVPVQPELNHGTAPPFEGGEEVRIVGVNDFLTAAKAITNMEARAVLKGHVLDVLSIVFCSDGKTIISGSADDTIR